MCFTFKIEQDKHIKDFDYRGAEDFADVLKCYPKQIPSDFDMPLENESFEEPSPEPAVVPGQTKSPRPILKQKPVAQQNNEPGAGKDPYSTIFVFLLLS